MSTPMSMTNPNKILISMKLLSSLRLKLGPGNVYGSLTAHGPNAACRLLL